MFEVNEVVICKVIQVGICLANCLSHSGLDVYNWKGNNNSFLTQGLKCFECRHYFCIPFR
jgi:hypothetical protein